MTPEAAIAALEAHRQPGKAEDMAAYHKAPRVYLGVANPDIDACAKAWRRTLDLDGRIALARGLWDSDIHEARVAAAKLLAQARIRPDDAVCDLIQSWVPTFDAWAIADHASGAAAKRLVADPSRLDTVETWLDHDNFWVRRAALVMTLPWTKQNHPKPGEQAARQRILGWCTRLAPDREWFIQKAIAWWLRELSKHDPEATRGWLASHGAELKPFAQREAGKYLSA